MKLTQVHHTPEGTYINHHPDPAVHAEAQAFYDAHDATELAFQQEVDAAPNLNHEYADELGSIQRLFNEDGLEIAPISVVTPETFTRLTADLAGYQDNFGGAYVMGRCLVQEDPYLKERFGKDFVLGMAMHEAAHSARSVNNEEKDSTVYSSTTAPTQLGAAALVPTLYQPGVTKESFSKVTKYEDQIKVTGDFTEEGFAELTRVRYLQHLGREPRINNFTSNVPDLGIRYVGEELNMQALPPKEGYVDVPVRFAALGKLIEDDKKPEILPGGAGHLAAYGLELLDQRLPGLFEQMQAARKDATVQRQIIQRINSIQPDLYSTLRGKFRYSDGGMLEAFKLIQTALHIEANTAAATPAQAN